MEGRPSVFPFPRTLEDVFKDFKGRHAGLTKALITDVDNFYAQCNPEKENLCLFSFRDETWKVNMPVEEVPPEIPEPALGINFARDGMPRKDWLALVALHSDAWLLSIAFYFGARNGFDKKDRKKLFKMINDLPTIFDLVKGSVEKQPSKKSTPNNNNNKNKNKPNGKMQNKQSISQTKGSKMPPKMQEDENESGGEGEDDDQGATCGACRNSYAIDEFWICCDVCELWFHGACVKITPAKAEHIKQYKCPRCNNKRVKV